MSKAPSGETFGYLEIPQVPKGEGYEQWMAQESFSEKFSRKVKENPFVPMGMHFTLILSHHNVTLIYKDSDNSYDHR